MKTSISLQDTTRKRLRYVCELINAPDYDKGINAVLDALGYPSWQDAEALSTKVRAEKKPEVEA